MRKASQNCFLLASHFEGCKLNAYLCSAGVWTIGIGTTIYPNGTKVKKGDTCTLEQAKEWFLLDIQVAEKKLDGWLNVARKAEISQAKIDALLSFIFNCGYGESLMKAVNLNPSDPVIWGCFLLYDKVRADKDGVDNDSDGQIDEPGEMKKVLGLMRRRNAEAHLYFKGELNFYENLKL